jgi:prepilin-type N-terminal cleavage/methylation domain-containing protein
MKKFSIFNSFVKFKRSFQFSFQRGFTLIELLVVLGIITILTTIIVSILVTVLRGTNKSDSIILVKQNGEHAISQIVRELRFAQSLQYPSPIGGAAPVCSSSGISVSEVRITSVSLASTTFLCPSSFNYPNFISINGVKLTNSNTVVVKSCNFVCTQSGGGPPTIGISFSLSEANAGPLVENNTTIPFQSSVTFRNL